jgi:hypothetical protein
MKLTILKEKKRLQDNQNNSRLLIRKIPNLSYNCTNE